MLALAIAYKQTPFQQIFDCSHETMKKSPAICSIILCFILSGVWANADVAEGPQEVETWFKSLAGSKQPEKMTTLHFYFHDLLDVKNATSTMVAQAKMTASSQTYFGSFVTADDPLTVGPEFSSKRVGYARGFYGAAALEEVGLVHAMAFVFTDGVYNGSSLSVLGYNPYHHKYREMPIVGGTGQFRLARGISTWQTYFFNTTAGNATVEIHVSVLHY